MYSSRGHFICCQQIHRISIFSCQLELLAPALHTELDTEYLAASKPLVEKIHKILTRNERWAYFRSLKTSGYHWSEKVVYFIVFGKQLDNDWSLDSWYIVNDTRCTLKLIVYINCMTNYVIKQKFYRKLIEVQNGMVEFSDSSIHPCLWNIQSTWKLIIKKIFN